MPDFFWENHTITESQNVGGWQGPLWVTQPNPLPKQGHPEQAAQHRGQAGLEYLQRRRNKTSAQDSWTRMQILYNNFISSIAGKKKLKNLLSPGELWLQVR